VQIIKLCSKYFLILMLVQGIIAAFIDTYSFKRSHLNYIARKARILGIGSIIIGIVLYFLNIKL